MKDAEKENLVVKGIDVSYKRINEEDYICLTDIAKVNYLIHTSAIKDNLIVPN